MAFFKLEPSNIVGQEQSYNSKIGVWPNACSRSIEDLTGVDLFRSIHQLIYWPTQHLIGQYFRIDQYNKGFTSSLDFTSNQGSTENPCYIGHFNMFYQSIQHVFHQVQVTGDFY
jgi:hypothetical protein